MAEYVKGLVSVVIPTYKRADLVKRAIDSVLAQTYTKLELLVVNDNSIGDEFSIKLYDLLSKYDDDRLKLVEQETHKNGAAARNVGIKNSKGEFIAFLDDDDYWETEKLECQVSLLSSLDKNWGAVSCLMRSYKNGKLIMSSLPYKSGNILIDILDRKTGLGTGAVLIRREALDKVGYFDENLIRHQDLQLFARLASEYKIKLVKKYLYNIEVSDARNRPTCDQILDIKKAYFKSIEDILRSLSSKDRNKIYIMHDFECAYVFLKNGKTGEGLKKLFSIFKRCDTFALAIYSVRNRFLSKIFKVQLEKKYI